MKVRLLSSTLAVTMVLGGTLSVPIRAEEPPVSGFAEEAAAEEVSAEEVADGEMSAEDIVEMLADADENGTLDEVIQKILSGGLDDGKAAALSAALDTLAESNAASVGRVAETLSNEAFKMSAEASSKVAEASGDTSGASGEITAPFSETAAATGEFEAAMQAAVKLAEVAAKAASNPKVMSANSDAALKAIGNASGVADQADRVASSLGRPQGSSDGIRQAIDSAVEKNQGLAGKIQENVELGKIQAELSGIETAAGSEADLPIADEVSASSS